MTNIEQVWHCGRCGKGGVGGIFCPPCREVLKEGGILADLAVKEAKSARFKTMWETRRAEMQEAIKAGKAPAQEGKD